MMNDGSLIRITIRNSSFTPFAIDVSPTDKTETLYQIVAERYKISQFHLSFQQLRIPQSTSMISDQIPIGQDQIVIDLQTQETQTTTLPYMCEQCGSTVC